MEKKLSLKKRWPINFGLQALEASEAKLAALCGSFKEKFKDDRGLGTLEIVIIIAVLMALAITFKDQIVAFSTKLFDAVFDNSVIDNISY